VTINRPRVLNAFRVSGWCVGGGHKLALWCDRVIASENTVPGRAAP
jgi:1,4-dihydroxy-2-naphthoyl-CoA synthase